MLRRTFFEEVVGVGAAFSVGARISLPTLNPLKTRAPVPDFFPRQDPDLAQAVVGASHTSLPRVRELVEARPALAKANWDWGFGDWESALDAASHTGQREIALFLLDHGARPTMFASTMLGKLSVVKALVESTPGIQRTLGPHGITLMAHARAGGTDARDVVAYLDQLGDADIRSTTIALDAATRAGYVGIYSFGIGEKDRFDVTEKAELLHMGRIGGAARNLYPAASDVFFPSGAPAVKVSFGRTGGRVTTVTVVDGTIEVAADRVS